MREFNIRPVQVSYAYSINSTCYVLEAQYTPDLAISKTTILMFKAPDDVIPTNHTELLNLVYADRKNEYNPFMDPLYQEKKATNILEPIARENFDANGETVTFVSTDNTQETI